MLSKPVEQGSEKVRRRESSTSGGWEKNGSHMVVEPVLVKEVLGQTKVERLST